MDRVLIFLIISEEIFLKFLKFELGLRQIVKVKNVPKF